MKINKIDNNFEIMADKNEDLFYYTPFDSAMRVEGLPWFYEDGRYERVKAELITDLSDRLKYLFKCTSGGCARFITNSTSIGIKAELLSSDDMSHMPRSGSSGFDIYVGSGTEKNFIKMAAPDSQSALIDCVVAANLEEAEKEVTINFPLYNGVKSFSVGLDKGSILKQPCEHKITKPILFYGSSITQGGCASRPGNSYTAMIGRRTDAEVINFGVSGNAKGELEIAEIIAGIKMSCFVMDYDHNAPTAEHLQRTHRPFFEVIRKKQPDLPIVLVSKPDADAVDGTNRRNIVKATFETAVNRGDKNVYFVDGKELFGDEERDACTVDGCHPNDLGFFRMANVIGGVVRNALTNK